MGLILQNQLERALVKTKDYIDKKIEETPESGYPDANIQAVDIGEEIEDVNIEYVTKDELQDAVENINPAPMVSVTYSELVELRDNGGLIAGMQYRITDYVTTTAQENTRSAGHPFDVIVTADSAYKLNEVARACLHEGDDYFLNEAPKLEAWKIWYCLDNDAERFAWAANPIYSPQEGRKMIMTEEGDNTYIYLYNGFSSIDNKHEWIYNHSGTDLSFKDVEYDDPNGEKYVYTDTEFPSIGETASLYTTDNDEYTLVFIKDVSFKEGKGVIYRMIDEFGNDCPYDFKNIMFKRNLNFDNGYAVFSEDGEETWVYTFAGQSYHIDNDEWSGMLDGSLESPFGHQSDEGLSTFHSNVIKPYIKFYDDINDNRTKAGIRYLNDNVFLGYWEEIGSTNEEDAPYYYPRCCFSNRLGNNCFSNSFNRECFFNSFGNDCHSITFGNYCSSITFGNYCSSNTFDSSCSYNTFGSGCHSNTFGSGCSYNTFGNDYSYNTFGNHCLYNTFGNYCSYNTFGNECLRNSFNDLSGRASKVRCTTLENGVSNVTFSINKQSGAYGNIQYYHVYMGVQNTTVNMSDNNKYEMGVACDQQGNVHKFCIMDFKNS